MGRIDVVRLADTLRVSLPTAESALAEAISAAPAGSLEIHGEARGRGFVGRRSTDGDGSHWTFTAETPRPISREPGPSPYITALEATISGLREALRQSEQAASEEHKARVELEREIGELRRERDRQARLVARSSPAPRSRR